VTPLGGEEIFRSNIKDAVFYGWFIVGASFLISFMGIGARYSYGVFLKSIEMEFGMTRGATSGVFSLYMLLCGVFAVLGGGAMDRYGPKKVGALMGAFTGLSLIVTSRSQAAWQLLITYSLLLSLGTGAIYGVVNATVARWFVRKRGLALGITSSGGGFGAIVIAPFATFLISRFDWRTAFVLMGFLSWMGITALSLLLSGDPRDKGLLPDGVKSKSLQAKLQDHPTEGVLSDFTLAQAASMQQFWLLGLAWVFLSLSLHMIFIHVVPYALDKGISPMDAAFTLSLLGITNILGRLVVGRLSDTLGGKPLGVTCALVMFFSLIGLVWANQLWMIYAFAMVYGFLWGGSGTVITVLTADIFGTRNLGTIMGMMTGGWAVGAAIGPAIGGVMFDMSGHYSAAFAAGAAALLTAAGLLALLKKRA